MKIWCISHAQSTLKIIYFPFLDILVEALYGRVVFRQDILEMRNFEAGGIH